MVYVRRDAAGRVVAVSTEPLDVAAEAVAAGAPEVVAFMAGLSPSHRFAESDQGMARVVEDLVDLLIRKGVVTAEELPAAAQAKLAERRTLRSWLDGLVDEGGGAMI